MYNACVLLSALFYGSESWTTYVSQERRLITFHMSSLRKLLGMLSRCLLPTMFTMLCQRRLCLLGQVRRMKDGRIPKDILQGQFIAGKRNLGCPQLHHWNVCNRDMKELNIELNKWIERKWIAPSGVVTCKPLHKLAKKKITIFHNKGMLQKEK